MIYCIYNKSFLLSQSLNRVVFAIKENFKSTHILLKKFHILTDRIKDRVMLLIVKY